MLLLVMLSLLASRSNGYPLDVGEQTVEIPVTFAFIGSIGCLNNGSCGSQKGSDYWSLAAIAVAYEDINNMPNLYYMHNFSVPVFDYLNAKKRSIL